MSQTATGGQPPNITMTPPKPQGKNQRTPSATQGKRNNRNNPRKNNTHVDGAVSDSVATVNPHTKKQGRPGQGAYPHNNQNGEFHGQKMRPVSVGGPMLPGTPAKERAYAQSTFQASPAASSLPVPKFFGSKSVPNAHAPSSLQARMDGEKTPEQPEDSSPEPDVVSPAKLPHGRNETPLDVFFMADKAEKERKNTPTNGFSPELEVRPPPASEPRNPSQFNQQSPFNRPTNDSRGSMVSPKTVPQGQRPPSFARAHSSPGNGVNTLNHSTGSNEVSTQALKDLLFNNINKQSSTPPQTQHRVPSNPIAAEHCSETPSPTQQRAAVAPTTPTPAKNTNQYSLHYGNRNLSPMFQAARAETPPRPSNLRQQMDQSGQQNGFPQYNQQLFSNQADPNSFSRSYLDNQIRASIPNQPPPGLISNDRTNSNNMTTAPTHFSGPPASSSPQYGMPIPNTTTGNPRNDGSRDVKGMEDDLRRMLKLDVLG
ncbi:hypothetical protein Q7P37_004928 [Cladosporium fusiforme]